VIIGNRNPEVACDVHDGVPGKRLSSPVLGEI
jgi:hypothetical protein